MKITFLEAQVPLTKRFTATEKFPYPNAFAFTSHTKQIADLKELAHKLAYHAGLGHCILKGELLKPLTDESRAGSTSPTTLTDWVCLDIDGLTSVNTIDEFMARIDLPDHSYVLQWSSSYGVNGNLSLRAHVFLALTKAVQPELLKMWLKQCNLERFQKDLTLTKTFMALRWGLDVTTCQNDKLIYITPPACTPPAIDQFVGTRIQYIKKTIEQLDFATLQPVLSEPQLRPLEEQAINDLRKHAGMAPRTAAKFKLKSLDGELYLPNPDPSTTYETRSQRGFTYLNLNGGDSWGYWHPDDNPTFIHNFKGEPVYKTEELLPVYWTHLQRAKRAAAVTPGRLYLAFHHHRHDQYYTGWYDASNDELTIAPAANEGRVNNFLESHGQPKLNAIPSWDVVYEPLSPVIDIAKQKVNLFKASRYMREACSSKAKSDPDYGLRPTPTIDRVLEHVMGAALVPHFMNWLAFCFVERRAPKTAWIWHGVQGTGKGLIIDYIITPIFGEQNVAQRKLEDLEGIFNAHLETALIMFVDEIQVTDSRRAKIIMQNLKSQITALNISIRRMHKDSYSVPNLTGWIFASNMPEPVTLEASDRRFNVGEVQLTKLDIELNTIQGIESELSAFSERLQNFKFSEQQAATPIMNSAKKALIEMSKTSVEVVAEAILKGFLSTLWDALPTGDTSSMSISNALALQPYQVLMHDLVRTKRDKLTREELGVIFTYNIGNTTPTSPHKLTSYLKRHGIHLKRIRDGAQLFQGIDVTWAETDEWFEERTREIAASASQKLKLVPPPPKTKP